MRCQIHWLLWVHRAWTRTIIISLWLTYLQPYLTARVRKIAMIRAHYKNKMRMKRKIMSNIRQMNPTIFWVTLRTEIAKISQEKKFRRSKMRMIRMGQMIRVKEVSEMWRYRMKWRAVYKRPRAKLRSLNPNRELDLFRWCRLGTKSRSKSSLWLHSLSNPRVEINSRYPNQ